MTKNDSIALHPKYGLNPTIPVCAYCGEDKNEVALLGNGYKEEAPHRMIINLEPCDLCKKKMALGITFIEVDDPKNPVPKQWIVTKREAIDKLPVNDKLKKDILRVGKCYIDSEAMSDLFGQIEPSVTEDSCK